MDLTFPELIFVLIPAIYGGDIDLDYFYGTGLRADTTLKCKNRLNQFNCQSKCNLRPALCIEDACYCMSIAPPYKKKPDIDFDLKYALRPTVRHHIAHFCPNLDVARECIRKCMVQGKPAFCGKDHVCYCGHKYTHTGKDDGGDAEKIYAQFKDLYKKYFGPNYGNGNVEV